MNSSDPLAQVAQEQISYLQKKTICICNGALTTIAFLYFVNARFIYILFNMHTHIFFISHSLLFSYILFIFLSANYAFVFFLQYCRLYIIGRYTKKQRENSDKNSDQQVIILRSWCCEYRWKYCRILTTVATCIKGT